MSDKKQQQQQNGRTMTDSAPTPTPEKTANKIAALFGTPTFKLPSKNSSYENNDGSTTTKMAIALIPLKGTGLVVEAAIMLTSGKKGRDAQGAYEYDETYLSLPSNSARQQIIKAETPTATRELDEWKFTVAQQYEKWHETLEGAKEIGTAAQTPRLIKRKQPTSAPAPAPANA